MDLNFGLIVLLIIASSAFSASEIALTSLTRAKVLAIKEDGKFASGTIARLKNTPQKVLVSILVGNQAANIVATFVATLWGVELFGEGKIGLFIFLFTLSLIIFGSILPKALALGFPELFARVLAYPLLVFVLITRPVIWIFELMINSFLSLFKINQNKLDLTSGKEIEAMIDIGAEEGVIEEGQDVFLKHVLRFGEAKVEEIMIPLKNIEAININTSLEDLQEILNSSQNTEFPVYNEDINTLRGTITLHELIKIIRNTKKKFPLKSEHFSQPVVVPKTATFIQLFKVLSEKKRQTAIVIDEYGQTIGLVTMMNIMEEVTGIRVKEKGPRPSIKKIARKLWELDGGVRVAEVNKELGVKLPYPEHQVMSLVVLEELKRFPETDEILEIDGANIKIKRVEKNVVKKLEISKKTKSKK